MNRLLITALTVCLGVSNGLGAEEFLVDHLDELTIDERLSLRQVIDTTFERYPQSALITAFQEESRALEQREFSGFE
jgi:hypothetical protein